MMSSATVSETFKDIWATVDIALRHEGFNLSEVAALRVACNNYLVERMDPTNSFLRDLTEKIAVAFDVAFPKDTPIAKITQLFSSIEAQLAFTGLLSHPAVNHNTWKSITLVIAHEKGKL
jgi:predicted DNA-binding ribbon-helix-helix protein